jgi:hypothetical protein
VVLGLVYSLCDAGLFLVCGTDPFSVAVRAALVFPLDLILVLFLFDLIFPCAGPSPKPVPLFSFA